MKLCDLLEGLIIVRKRYAKKNILIGISNALGIHLGLSDSALEKIARNDRTMRLQPDSKQALMRNWEDKESAVLDFLEGLIDDVEAVAIELGLPKGIEYKKRLLCKAVREQFRMFFDPSNEDEDIANVIYGYYAQLLECPDTSPVQRIALYPGDSAHDYSKTKEYTMDIYGMVTHEMELQNIGSVIWVNRKLICVDHNSYVRPVCSMFDIPETGRNGITKLRIEVVGRGIEGKTILHWKMVDSNESDCFPDEAEKFRFTVLTQFDPAK